MIASRFVLHVAAALGLCAALPILWGFYAPVDWHLDASHHAVGRDFVNLWVSGRLLLEGAWQTLFDHAAYQDALHRLFDPQLRKHVWSYPPTSFLLAVPLALMPYSLALALWTLAGLAAFVAAARTRLDPKAAGLTTVVLLLAPATLLNIICGQNGFFTAALFAGTILMLDTRPILAGILCGLLSYKPHLGIVVAPALVALGAWTTIAAAAATSISLVLASMALFGVEPWLAFLRETVPYQGFVLQRFIGYFTTMLVSPYAALRTLEMSHGSAQSVQSVLAIAAVVGCALAVRRTKDADRRLALVVAATFIATPYALTYDLPIVALVVGRLYALRPDARWSLGEALIYGGVWAVPLASMLLLIVSVPLTPVLMAGLFMLQVRPLVDFRGHPAGFSWPPAWSRR